MQGTSWQRTRFPFSLLFLFLLKVALQIALYMSVLIECAWFMLDRGAIIKTFVQRAVLVPGVARL